MLADLVRRVHTVRRGAADWTALGAWLGGESEPMRVGQRHAPRRRVMLRHRRTRAVLAGAEDPYSEALGVCAAGKITSSTSYQMAQNASGSDGRSHHGAFLWHRSRPMSHHEVQKLFWGAAS